MELLRIVFLRRFYNYLIGMHIVARFSIVATTPCIYLSP